MNHNDIDAVGLIAWVNGVAHRIYLDNIQELSIQKNYSPQALTGELEITLKGKLTDYERQNLSAKENADLKEVVKNSTTITWEDILNGIDIKK